MNARQSVLIAMFLSLVVFVVATISITSLQTQAATLKQVSS